MLLFVMDTPVGDAELAICVECNYVAWINGEFVGTGQFTDYPGSRTGIMSECTEH